MSRPLNRLSLHPELERRAPAFVDDLVGSVEDLTAIDTTLESEDLPTIVTGAEAEGLPVPERIGAFRLAE